MRARFAATLALIVSACGDNASVAVSNGSRLAVYNDLLPDGTRIPTPYDFFDVGRGEFCDLETWSDGATYCTPLYTVPVFSDAQCSTSVIRQPPATVTLRYSVDLFQTAAGTTQISKLRTIGAPMPGIDRFYRATSDGCMGPFFGGTFFEPGSDTIGSDAFVRVRRLPDEAGDRLAQIRLHGDDGLVVPYGFHDNELGFDCRQDGTQPCTPIHTATAAYWSDATCSVPAYPRTQAGADAVFAPGPGCGTYYRATSIDAGSTLYDDGDGMCAPAPVATPSYQAGEPLALATRDRVRIPSNTRFQRYRIGDQIDTTVHDSVLDLDCVVSSLGCYPDAVPVQDAFTDATCTTPIQVAAVPLESCGDPPSYAEDAAGFHPLAAAYPSPVYVPSTGDTCIRLQPDAGTAFHAIGAAIPTEAFATTTTVY